MKKTERGMKKENVKNWKRNEENKCKNERGMKKDNVKNESGMIKENVKNYEEWGKKM